MPIIMTENAIHFRVLLSFVGARTPEVNNARSKLDGVLQGLVHKKDDADR